MKRYEEEEGEEEDRDRESRVSERVQVSLSSISQHCEYYCSNQNGVLTARKKQVRSAQAVHIYIYIYTVHTPFIPPSLSSYLLINIHINDYICMY